MLQKYVWRNVEVHHLSLKSCGWKTEQWLIMENGSHLFPHLPGSSFYNFSVYGELHHFVLHHPVIDASDCAAFPFCNLYEEVSVCDNGWRRRPQLYRKGCCKCLLAVATEREDEQHWQTLICENTAVQMCNTYARETKKSSDRVKSRNV